MTAKHLYEKHIGSTMRPPTRRKILNAAKRHGLRDTYGELHWFLGGYLTHDDLRSFIQDGQGRACVDPALDNAI